MNAAHPAALLLRSLVPIGFGPQDGTRIDVLISPAGRVEATGPNLDAAGARVIDGGGAYMSPGWVDLHTHIYWGGTSGSLRPATIGAVRGVTTLVDAGSAGEANFAGFREFIIEPARERIRAFLNIGSIGLVAGNRVPELTDIRCIDIDRTIACVEANRDLICGIKVRASHVILGSWGITPVRVAKKVAKILRLPLMVHVGEPPPLYDEVLEVLGPGDIVTHCFNGKSGGSIAEDEDLFQLATRCAAEGVRLDVGHGAASFSFRVAQVAIERGLLPYSISTDLHVRSVDGPVWDLATTASKLLAMGMVLPDVVRAITTAPLAAIGLPSDDLLAAGTRADFTLFDISETDHEVHDSMRHPVRLDRMIEPRQAVIGTEVVAASRHLPTTLACPCCGGPMPAKAGLRAEATV